MKKLISVGVLVAFLVLLPACKGSTTPEPPAVTVVSISVTSASTMLLVGATETFTATATMSDSTMRAATSLGNWSSDNTSAATVNSTGLVTITGPGTANISLVYSGKTGSKSMRGLPNYQGTWGPGTYRIDSCSNTGDFATGGFCGVYPVGTTLETALVMTQTSDMVNCTFFLGTLSSTASGQIATNGQLTLTGRISYSTTNIDVIYNLQQMVPGQLTGALGELWTDTTVSGNGQFGCTIITLAKTSPAPNESVISRMAPPKGATFKDLLHAIGIR